MNAIKVSCDEGIRVMGLYPSKVIDAIFFGGVGVVFLVALCQHGFLILRQLRFFCSLYRFRHGLLCGFLRFAQVRFPPSGACCAALYSEVDIHVFSSHPCRAHCQLILDKSNFPHFEFNIGERVTLVFTRAL